jgi:acetoin utilization deacetylase AcuC-like enzyme
LKVFTCDRFTVPLPEWHRFPMIKYARLRQRVEASGLVAPENLLIPQAATDDELLLAHDAEYIRKVTNGLLSKDEIRTLGFPWTASLVERSRRSVGATIEACRLAFLDGVAVSLAGGTHHAYRDHGAGFCVFNDAAVAARVIQEEGKAARVLIIDCDVHQGDGTASIFADDPTVFTFSIHGAMNYPLQKQTSDLDVELDDGAQDEAYLAALESGLGLALERSKPDLAIYLAGADPFIYDRLGRLRVSKLGLAERDRLVFSRCRSAGVPVAVTMAGGYAEEVTDTVDIHFQTVVEAAQAFRAPSL